MSHGGKSSKISKKRKPAPKSKPTSAEYVIDSDSESGTQSKENPSSSKSKSIGTHESSSTHNLKRKAADISRSDHLENDKLAKDHREITKESSSKETIVNERHQRKIDDGNKLLSSPRSSSEEISSDNEGSTVAVITNASNQRPISILREPSVDLEEISRSEQEHGDQSTDDEESEGEDVHADTRNGIVQADVLVAPANANSVTKVPPFRPPDGFSIASVDSDHTARTRDIFSEENLRGKEIWHFTVPASLPIDDFKAFTKSDMLSGKSVLTHQGFDYSFNVEAGKVAIPKILIPARKGNKYQPVSASIHQTLHLRQILRLPNANSGSISGADSISGARKAILKQPKGLKLGYTPFGSAETDVDEHTALEQAEQRIDNTKIPASTEALPSVDKAKKLKKSSSTGDKMTEWVDPEAYSAPVVVGSASQHTVEFPTELLASTTSQTLPESRSGHTKTNISDEKARRKAEKAARREARKARKEAKASKE